MRNDILIVGGGFPGIYSAWRFARGGMRVCLTERPDHLGRALWSRSWTEYLVDIGMQDFDMSTPFRAEFSADILGPNMLVLDKHDCYSTMGRDLALGFEMPSFTQIDPYLCQTALQELSTMAQADHHNSSNLLNEHLVGKFGPPAKSALISIAQKIVAGPIKGLSSDAMGIRLEALKGVGARIVFGSPKFGALRTFYQMTQTWLAELEVDIQLNSCCGAVVSITHEVEPHAEGNRFRAGRSFWTMDYSGLLRHLSIANDLRTVTHTFGTALYAPKCQPMRSMPQNMSMTSRWTALGFARAQTSSLATRSKRTAADLFWQKLLAMLYRLTMPNVVPHAIKSGRICKKRVFRI